MTGMQENGKPSGDGSGGGGLMDNLSALSNRELLTYHAAILKELQSRGVVRTQNAPLGDWAEYEFCRLFNWKMAANSEKSIDATANDGTTYQIKARRVTAANRSRQLSFIRDLDGFDTLAAMIVDEEYNVILAALIPAEIVRENSSYVASVNGYRFIFRDSVMELPGVVDVTDTMAVIA